ELIESSSLRLTSVICKQSIKPSLFKYLIMSIILLLRGVVVGIVLLLVVVFNRFVKNKNMVKDAWSNIDVALQRRYDLIPNLVETVKGYAAHEKTTLESVINARNAAMAVPSDDINGQIK